MIGVKKISLVGTKTILKDYLHIKPYLSKRTPFSKNPSVNGETWLNSTDSPDKFKENSLHLCDSSCNSSLIYMSKTTFHIYIPMHIYVHLIA